MTRPALADFQKKALKNPEIRAEYKALSPAYALCGKLLAPLPNATKERTAGGGGLRFANPPTGLIALKGQGNGRGR